VGISARIDDVTGSKSKYANSAFSPIGTTLGASLTVKCPVKFMNVVAGLQWFRISHYYCVYILELVTVFSGERIVV
jgi:hypothetical protein